MRNFNVSRRLAGLLAAFGLAMVLAVAAFTVLLRGSMASSTAVTTQATTQLGRSYVLLQMLTAIHSDLQRFMRLKDPDEMEKALAGLKDNQKRATDLIAGAGAEIGGVKAKYEALLKEENAVLEDVLRGEVSSAQEKFFGPTATQYESLLTELGKQQEVVSQSTTALLAAHSTQARRSMIWQTGVLSLVFVGLILFGWRLKNQIVRELKRISGVLAESGAQLTNAAGQVSSSSQSLAEGSSEQAASIEETSSSLEEMASMTQRNAENAHQANALAKQARAAADLGAGDMQAMSAAMNSIKTSSDDIAKIIKTIDEIAFQTNILALNAAVEAARAGEAGMGFAVVADEVRSLAQRSAQAAKETAGKIEAAISKTTQGVEINGKVARALNEIVAKARQVDELIAEVANASREQSQGITQINAAVGQMDKVTQSNAANAEESAAAAEELNAQALVMKDSVTELLKLIGGKGLKTTGASGTAQSAAPSKASGNGHARSAGSSLFRAAKPSSAPTNLTARQRAEIPLDGDFKDF